MKKRILCFGDSNTWGYIPGTGERYDEETRWTSLLAASLGENYAVIEEGLSSRRTVYDDGMEYVNGRKALGYILKSQQPLDAAVVLLGTNDLVEHSMERVELGITEIIRFLQNANWIIPSKTPIFPHGAKILLVSPIPYGDSSTLPDEKKKESLMFPFVTRRIAENMKVSFLDPSSLVYPSDVDGIHLTAEAHRLLSDEIYKALQKMDI